MGQMGQNLSHHVPFCLSLSHIRGFRRWFVAEFCHMPRVFSNTVPKCPIPSFCSTGMPHADSERDRIIALSSHHGNIVRWCNKGRQASSVIKSPKCDSPVRCSMWRRYAGRPISAGRCSGVRAINIPHWAAVAPAPVIGGNGLKGWSAGFAIVLQSIEGSLQADCEVSLLMGLSALVLPKDGWL